MAETVEQTKDRIAGEMQGFPAALTTEFARAWKDAAKPLSGEQLAIWAEGGLALTRQSVRSWEAASEYFKVSSEVIGRMPFSYFVKWTDYGSRLCEKSPALAICYFRASPVALENLRSRHIESWSKLGESLYKGTWKSSTLACSFFDASPALLKSLSVAQLEEFAAVLEALSRRSYDLSLDCLALGIKAFPLMGEDKDALLSATATVSGKAWRQTKSFLETTIKALPKVEATQRVRLVQMGEQLIDAGSPNVPGAIVEISQSLGKVDKDHHGQVLSMAESLLAIDSGAMPEFVKSVPGSLDRVSMNQLGKWFDEGVRILKENNDAGLAYFRSESARSQHYIESLSSSVEFARVKDVMEMYCRALAGSKIKVAESEELVDKSIGWVSSEAPSTEGSTVFIPSQVDQYPTKAENFGWFKVVSTHQVAHIEFGSFDFEFDRPSTLFRDLRPTLAQNGPRSNGSAGDGPTNSAERGWVTDMQRFFDVFDDRKLALDIFTVVEDARLDARVKSEYVGIEGAYVRVQEDALAARPEIKSMPAREALVELLVRLSLSQQQELAAPKQYVEEVKKVARTARRMARPGATVEDSAEAALRIYAIISRIANEDVPEDDWMNLDFDSRDFEEGEDAADDLLDRLLDGDGSFAEPEYQPSQDVDFRGDFKPELVQLLSALRDQDKSGNGGEEGESITQEMVEDLLDSSAEIEADAKEGDAQKARSAAASNILREAARNGPSNPEFSQGPQVHVDEEGGPLDPTGAQTFAYDEWDFRAEDYKPSWCVVHQKAMAEGNQAYYGNTLHSYGPLVTQIRRQFELLVPESLRKVRKLEDGEEIDIDDVIEAFVDIRTGVGPSEKLYWRRNKVQRDVAVVFLLDTSASTAEAIDDSRRVADEWDAPDDPVEYMVWLRSRRGEGLKRSYKRIIDLEKEAVVLLIHALEAIGDVYGIYGFSGYGRENVEFYTIKDIEETLSDSVKRRIDRIAPLHATRMGPAIRHATWKLEAQDARTKLLFLISDGRPQDRGYSREGVEKEYAVHDTKMALDEAKGKDVTAFCLTVDKNGHDYLKTMCQDMGYEVLDDIYTLPSRLLYLYKTLTM